ncbi:hypothetical protein NQ315_007939 [Exocentrus adspersus]|uniref:Uncharacterized protein n=1 Tax=Exocentrus adspersus TaxID=1586481 RepID=A0AAV8VBM6_9CUCU|nr:hypothetical protein NQ315_007939 [Exocentrus adspersus]
MNFITTDIVERLGLRMQRVNLPVVGISQTSLNISYKTKAIIKSQYNNFHLELSFFVLNQIADKIPSNSFEISNIEILSDVKLADPTFNQSGKIDMLKSQLGWIIAGPVGLNSDKVGRMRANACNFVKNANLDGQLERFWKVEEFDTALNKHTHEEIACEKHFLETFSRQESGRFTVQLPIREEVAELGNSEINAKKRFLALESKLSRSNSIEAARRIKQEITQILESGCFILRKWLSNEPEILTENSQTSDMPEYYILNDNNCTKMLGLFWDAQADVLKYVIKFDDHNQKITKRLILATIAQIFDPLGLIGPTSVIFR